LTAEKKLGEGEKEWQALLRGELITASCAIFYTELNEAYPPEGNITACAPTGIGLYPSMIPDPFERLTLRTDQN
jgi:hypothetical protein